MSLAWSSVKALTIPFGGLARDVKRVAVGGVEVWRKRPFDAEVEYIESTGTQYVDTGVPMSGENEINARLLIENSGIRPFGAQNDNVGTRRNQWLAIGGNGANAQWNASVGSSTNAIVSPVGGVVGSICEINAISNSLTVNGATATATGWTLVQDSQPNVYIFACSRIYSGGNLLAVSHATMRLYSFQILGSGTPIRDFIPVRVGSGASAVGYLYDRSNPTGGPSGNGLYGNSGTGAFTIGPDKSS